jgi:hypothetical protein
LSFLSARAPEKPGAILPGLTKVCRFLLATDKIHIRIIRFGKSIDALPARVYTEFLSVCKEY